jgi:hypothetical protein
VFLAGLPAAIARAEFTVVQTGFVLTTGPAEGNVVEVGWDHPAGGANRASILVDAVEVGSVTPVVGRNVFLVKQADPDFHVFEVIEGTDNRGASSHEVLSEWPPVGIPELGCAQSEDDCDIIVSGPTPGPPGTFVEVFVDGESRAKVEQEFNGQAFDFVATIPVTTRGAHDVVAYLVADRNHPFLTFNGTYSLEIATTCVTTCGLGAATSYIPGLCNGDGDKPDISSPVFGLNFLFGGGPRPPCVKACEANGAGGVDISDMVYVLNFLFGGGRAPVGWRDSTGDGRADATCVEAAQGDDCETGHEACSP